MLIITLNERYQIVTLNEHTSMIVSLGVVNKVLKQKRHWDDCGAQKRESEGRER